MNKTRPNLVLVGLLIALFVSAMDQTVVSTALGTIVSDLGGMDKYVWVTSAYLITELSGMPIYGKLSDMFGRKRFFVFGMIVFLIGSILCGMAHSMIELSVYRAIQGIGGGALMPIAYTITFSVIPDEKRGRVGGLLGSAFGLASILGPLLGSYITEYLSWRWIFYVNLLPGLISLALIVFFFHETLGRTRETIDWLGTFTLIGSIVCLTFAMQLGGNEYAWNSPIILSLFGAAAFLFVSFLYVERSTADPIISFRMLKNKLLSTSLALSFFYGIAYIVVIVYIPLFIEGVLGRSATNSGLILIPLLLSSILTSMSGSLFLRKFGFRFTMLLSGCIYSYGVFLLIHLSENTTPLLSTLYMVVIGIGVGFSFSVLSIGTNRSVEKMERGAANSMLTFLRAFGMTVGLTIFGIIQSHLLINRLSGELSKGDAGIDLQKVNPTELLTPQTRSQLPHEELKQLTDALAYSLTHMFVWLFVPAVLILILATRMSAKKLPVSGKRAN